MKMHIGPTMKRLDAELRQSVKSSVKCTLSSEFILHLLASSDFIVAFSLYRAKVGTSFLAGSPIECSGRHVHRLVLLPRKAVLRRGGGAEKGQTTKFYRGDPRDKCDAADLGRQCSSQHNHDPLVA